MKKLFLSIMAITALGFVTSCSSDDNTPVVVDDGPQGEVITKTGLLTANETWTANNIYILDGKVVINEGVTLTIEPGTIIKGAQGQDTQASALIVDQGGKLIADGTASEPIIFTSILDNIAVGQTAGTNLTVEDSGLWGGVLVLGRAPISVSGDLLTNQIEGIPANEPFGQYGGNISNDNSGIIRYVSIRHGGIAIGQDNEINGLTLGGVGSGTIIDHVEVVANQDDAFEWFGGTVNASNLLAWGQQDDGLDVDQSYSGTISNAVVIQTANSDRAIEIDGPEGSAATYASFTMNSITLIGNAANAFYADYRDGARGSFNNVLAYGFGADAKIRFNGQASQDNFVNGIISFSNWQIVLPAGVPNVGALLVNTPAGSETNFTSHATAIANPSAATVGANLGVFTWTFASQKGAL
ncbi:MAG: hypothetical protein CVU03_00235 [Bacteroidetes bacterium HGW-Bacteroidetes-2]|jgi:hypothetical protein|nr:MAG: hypothetical protein CVU03_00235 [Bacteroidetes bacterium HGW-Bacteroidetes-2]